MLGNFWSEVPKVGHCWRRKVSKFRNRFGGRNVFEYVSLVGLKFENGAAERPLPLERAYVRYPHLLCLSEQHLLLTDARSTTLPAPQVRFLTCKYEEHSTTKSNNKNEIEKLVMTQSTVLGKCSELFLCKALGRTVIFLSTCAVDADSSSSCHSASCFYLR